MSDEWRRGEYLISTDRSLLNVSAIHQFLADSYWAKGIPRDVVERSIENSLSFGLYTDRTKVSFQWNARQHREEFPLPNKNWQGTHVLLKCLDDFYLC